MEYKTWDYGLSTSSSADYNHSTNQSTRYDGYNNYEESDMDGDDLEAEYPCPFCSEDFDIVGLCCHIEDVHSFEAKKGICPLCGTRLGGDLDHWVEHVAMEHEHIPRSESRRRHSGRESNSASSILWKELDHRNIKSILDISPPPVVSSSSAALDTLLTSFIGSHSTPADVRRTPPSFSDEICPEEKPLDGNALERDVESLSLNDEKKEEMAQRCKFVQSLMISTMLDNGS